jgi:GNAT superfamily N-acetyltransferase
VKRLVASCFVLVETATGITAGYYTLAATSILANELPADVLKRLPRYPSLPAALIGRLAVDRRFHRRGFGGALLADAALRVLRSDTRAFALVVEAKDESAVAFYRTLGFRPFNSRPMAMFLPLATARQAATAPDGDLL